MNLLRTVGALLFLAVAASANMVAQISKVPPKLPQAIQQRTPVRPPLHIVRTEKVLAVTLDWQETNQWCWAASGEMVMEYLAPNPRMTPQCYQANQRFGRTDCCSTCPTPAACIWPGWPEFDTWGFNSTTVSVLTWPQVVAEINAGRPFVFAWAWHGGGGHAMVAKGYTSVRINSIPMFSGVWMNNPWPPASRCASGANASGPFGGDMELISYDEFVGGPNFNHDHMADIYQVAHR